MCQPNEKGLTHLQEMSCFAGTVMMKTEWIPVSLSRSQRSRKTVMHLLFSHFCLLVFVCF